MILTLGLEVGANYLINLPGITHILNSIHYYRNGLGLSHLSQLVLDPGLKGSLVPVPTARGRNRSLIPVGARWYHQPGPKGPDQKGLHVLV